MSQSKQLMAGLLALGASFSLPVAVSADESTDAPFKIMNAGEVATHTAAMKALEGAAREDYRNAQYAQLKERAARNGYLMPDEPPWATAPKADSTEATAAVTAPPDGPQAQARHAELREKLEASRAVAEKAAEANLQQFEPPPAAAAAKPGPAEMSPAPVPGRQAAPASVAAGAGTTTAPPLAGAPEAAGPADHTAPAQRAVETPPVSPRPIAKIQGERGYAGYDDMTAPTPPSPPPAPARKVPGSTSAPAPAAPRFMPPEVAAEAQSASPTEPVATAAAPTVPGAPILPPPTPETPPVAASAPEPAPMPPTAPAYSAAPAASDRGQDAMSGYREQMRARFDDYMKERQAQIEEKARLQREQHEASMARNRAGRPGFTPLPAPTPSYPAGPAYGPRYPAAYPGYRTPYWQQQP